jgi:hypothetical protein
MAGMLAVPALFVIGMAIYVAFANATAPKPVPAAALPLVVAAMVALGVLLGLLGIAFGVLRTVVTERAVHVRYGLWGPTIPIANIRSCGVVDYQWRRVLVGADDAAETARQIEKLRAAASEGARARVADEPAAAESDLIDEESRAQMKR